MSSTRPGTLMRRVERELGLVARGGGRHEGLGTRNRIVPLGGGYLELLAIADPYEAASSDFGRALFARLAQSATACSAGPSRSMTSHPSRRLATRITTIRRPELSAQLTGLAEAIREPFLPFFINRDPGVPDPGADGDAGGITSIELAGDAARLRRWLDGSPLPVRVVPRPTRGSSGRDRPTRVPIAQPDFSPASAPSTTHRGLARPRSTTHRRPARGGE